ncbi:MAG: dNTP triphosphohydrolase [Bacteroidaceae bacterium]|jgi:dGTPase|nr:dNTP triphosphohydrolase [Bacteroidaceae bacterium]
MDWERLISAKRLGMEGIETLHKDDRSAFLRDYDRLIFSAPFRRLQNKTQVFPLPGSVFVHNRLTHSLEVACVGRSLGNNVSRGIIQQHPELAHTNITEIGNIVSAACLAHDMGNPPFGHSGEKAISAYFTEGKGQCLKEQFTHAPAQWTDIINFEGNANAFRLLAHQFIGRRKGGFAMTYSTLASIVKYPYSSYLANGKHKFGFFDSEAPIFAQIADELGIICLSEPGKPLKYVRYPLVWLVEAADDICYLLMDLEDAHKLKIFSTEKTIGLMMEFLKPEEQEHAQSIVGMVTDVNEQVSYLRSKLVGLLVEECTQVFLENEQAILDGTFSGSLIKHISDTPRQAYIKCAELSKEKIYRSRDVLEVELAGFRIISTLLDLMVEAVQNPDREYSKLLIDRVSSQYDIKAQDIYNRIQAVLDYISGMTDVYALDIYRKINGNSLPAV